jgi:hypothetical protein
MSCNVGDVTFMQLRGDRHRTWVRCSDLIAAGTAAANRRFTRYEVRMAIAHLPKPKVKHHGHFHYGQEHLDAVIAAARSGA